MTIRYETAEFFEHCSDGGSRLNMKETGGWVLPLDHGSQVADQAQVLLQNVQNLHHIELYLHEDGPAREILDDGWLADLALEVVDGEGNSFLEKVAY